MLVNKVRKNAFFNFLFFFSFFFKVHPVHLKTPLSFNRYHALVVFSVPHMKVKKWPHPLIQSHPYYTVQTERSCPWFPLVPLSIISTIYLSVLFCFFHSCHAVHLQWNRNAEMQRTKLREREKREANALFFIADSHLSVSPEKDTLNKISNWMNGETVQYRNMAGQWRHCLFSFKARARSPKGKEVEKVWLMNRLIEAFHELDCQRVFELHSVEGHDGCFSTHYVYLRLDWGFLSTFRCIYHGGTPNKNSSHHFKIASISVRLNQDILQFVCWIPPIFQGQRSL